MKKFILYIMSIRNNHPKVVVISLEAYLEDLRREFPNDADLGKYMRNN
jgi:hypothetical protein